MIVFLILIHRIKYVFKTLVSFVESRVLSCITAQQGIYSRIFIIFTEVYGRIRKIVVKYVSESSQGFTQWRLDRLDPVKGGCHMTLAEILMCSIALCQLVIMVIALFQGK